jgi:hypothetical protein
MATICIGATLIAAGGYLVSIKPDQPNYKLQRNFGIFFLVVGALMFLGGLFVEIATYMTMRSLQQVQGNGPINNGGSANAIIPPANNGGRKANGRPF